MITFREAALALYGSYRLLRLDPKGLDYFDRTPRGFWLSFYGPAVVLPLALGFDLLVGRAEKLHIGMMETGDYVIWQAASYVLTVLGHVLAMSYLARAIDKGHNFIQFVVAYNWAAIIQAMIFFPIALISALFFPDSGFFSLLVSLAMAVWIAYAWYIIRTALTENGWMAGAFLIFELMVGLLVDQLVLILY